MIVEELLATLGLKVDTEKFIEAEGLVGKLKVALGALAVTLGVKELKEMVHGVAEMADAANKSSQKLGITAESLQELGYAAKLADVSQGQLEGALFRLSKGLDKVSQTGKGPAADALRRLHINMKDLKGEGLDANLEVIADAFAKMPDGSEKATLAMKLFGGAGKAMIPLLNGGSAAIREQREEAQRLGIVVSDELAKKFEEFNDDQTRISEAWRGIRVQIVSALLPALHELVTGMLEWIKSHEPLIRGVISAALEAVTVSFKVLGVIVSELTDFLQAMFAHPEAVVLFAGVIAAVFIPAILEATIATWALAAAWLAVNWPILAIAAAIAAVILIINHWSEITKVLGEAWDSVAETIKGYAQGFADWITSAWSRTIDAISSGLDQLGQDISDGVNKALDILVEKAQQTAVDVWKALEDIPGVGTSFVIADKLQQLVSPSADVDDRLSRAIDSIPPDQQGAVNATFGDTSVTIQTTGPMDEEKVGQLAAAKVAEAQRNMIGDAYESLRGGKR